MVVAAGAFLDAGDHSAGVGIGVPAWVRKAASESVTSSTTMQNDNDLTFTMVAGAVYEVQLSLSVQGSASGDVKTGWSVPADATGGTKFVHGPASVLSTAFTSREDTAASVSTHGYTVAKTYHIEANAVAILEWGLISSATGGTFTLQWAQSTPNATATVMNQASYLRYTRVA